jgi:hypothetical protein
MINLAMVTFLSFTSPVIQDVLRLGSSLMQNRYYGAYTLKAGSSSFM